MKENYCVLSLKKIHSMGSLQVSHEHNFRELPLKHVDISMSHKNEELINDTGADYRELWYRRIKEVELSTGQSVAVRKNAVLAYEIVTTFSKEADVDLEAWKEANVKWMKDTFGEDNVLSMQFHIDETTPHIHTIVVPIDERGKLCAKTFTGGRGKMFALQTSYGKAMEPLGLKRGEMYSRSSKEDLGRFYATLNKAANAEAPQMKAGERVDDYVSRVNAYIQNVEMKSLWKEKELTRAVELEQTKRDQMHAKYSEAIKLQDDLEESFGGNMRLVKERLKTYQKIEKSVPRKILDSFLTNLLQRFPFSENIRNYKEKKKKKKQTEFGMDEM